MSVENFKQYINNAVLITKSELSSQNHLIYLLHTKSKEIAADKAAHHGTCLKMQTQDTEAYLIKNNA